LLNLTMQNLAKFLGGRYNGAPKVIPLGVAIDSRKVKEGDLFFAIKGENADGHHYVDAALANGAVGAVISDISAVEEQLDKNLLICEDTIRFLQDLAKLIRQNMMFPVIAVTGSTGKTTTKDMVFSVLQEKFNTVKTEGNYNNELGLPLTLCIISKEHEALVLEMGMRGLGQVSFLCKMAQPTHGIITNIGQVHAELLGSQERIAQAKAELLDFIPSQGSVLLNCKDRQLLKPWLEKCQGAVIWFGLDSDADIWAGDIHYLGEKGSRFKVHFAGDTQEIELSIPGEHNILNALAAIGIARSLDINWEEIQRGLANIELTAMRLQIEEAPQGAKIINDTYNANPSSMEAAIKVLVSMPGERKIAVLGDMYELGIYEESEHYHMGQIAYQENVDLLVAVGKLGQLIGQGAIQSGMKAEKIKFFNDNITALEYLKRIIIPTDLILVKGSRGMKMEAIVQGLMR